jgi:hypothetical protein
MKKLYFRFYFTIYTNRAKLFIKKYIFEIINKIEVSPVGRLFDIWIADLPAG